MENLVNLNAKKEEKRNQYLLEILNTDAGYEMCDLEEHSLIELRDLRDELIPTIITTVQGTAAGKTVKRSVLKVA